MTESSLGRFPALIYRQNGLDLGLHAKEIQRCFTCGKSQRPGMEVTVTKDSDKTNLVAVGMCHSCVVDWIGGVHEAS